MSKTDEMLNEIMNDLGISEELANTIRNNAKKNQVKDLSNIVDLSKTQEFDIVEENDETIELDDRISEEQPNQKEDDIVDKSTNNKAVKSDIVDKIIENKQSETDSIKQSLDETIRLDEVVEEVQDNTIRLDEVVEEVQDNTIRLDNVVEEVQDNTIRLDEVVKEVQDNTIRLNEVVEEVQDKTIRLDNVVEEVQDKTIRLDNIGGESSNNKLGISSDDNDEQFEFLEDDYEFDIEKIQNFDINIDNISKNISEQLDETISMPYISRINDVSNTKRINNSTNINRTNNNVSYNKRTSRNSYENSKKMLNRTSIMLSLLANLIFYCIAIFMIISVCKYAYNFSYQIYGDVVSEKAPGREISVEIKPNTSAFTIAKQLEINDIIVNKYSFMIRYKLSEKNIQPATYTLSTSMNYGEILDIICSYDTSEKKNKESTKEKKD